MALYLAQHLDVVIVVVNVQYYCVGCVTVGNGYLLCFVF